MENICNSLPWYQIQAGDSIVFWACA